MSFLGFDKLISTEAIHKETFSPLQSFQIFYPIESPPFPLFQHNYFYFLSLNMLEKCINEKQTFC